MVVVGVRGWEGERLLVIFFLWPVCMCVDMGRFESSHAVFAIVSVISLIVSEKEQMHAIVIIGHQLIFSP